MRYLLFILIAISAPGAAFSQSRYSLTGTVTGPDGAPLSGVIVSMQCGHHAQWSHEGKTGRDGKYRFEKLECSDYLATFAATGYETWREVISKIERSGATYLLDVRLKKGGAWGGSISTHIYRPVLAHIANGVIDRYRKEFLGHRKGGRADAMGAAESYDRPVLNLEAPAGVSTKTGDEITSVPMRSGSDVAVRSAKRSDYRADPDDARAVTVLDPVTGETHTKIVRRDAEISAGKLTSGEINDFAKWTLWEGEDGEALKTYRDAWPIRAEERFSVIVKSREGGPLANARVRLACSSGDAWEAITDNTGKAELWLAPFRSVAPIRRWVTATVDYGRERHSIPQLQYMGQEANIINTKIPCNNPAKLDIAFIVDATGSMGDEINYLKAELRDILQKVADSMPATSVQTGALFYRDLSDEYLTRASDLTTDFAKTEAFIADNGADGGGDTPEGVDAALEAGLRDFSWRADATARLAFLVLDAPPHGDSATVKKMQGLTAQYAARGIRLIPVVCSGSDKPTEYLMRSMALLTNGTYLFLTDHSGIGGSHTAPTTSAKVDVEYLNGLIYRVIYQCAYMPPCAAYTGPADTSRVQQPTDSATTIAWRYWPNPTTGVLHIEHTHTSGFLLVSDVSGKAILRVPADASGTTTIDLRQYPAGLYAIRYNWAGDKWLSGKFVVVH